METTCLTRCEARMLQRSSPEPEREFLSGLTAISPRLVHSRPRSMRVNERTTCSGLRTRFASKNSFCNDFDSSDGWNCMNNKGLLADHKNLALLRLLEKNPRAPI